jgi:hypothetical protein
MPRNVYRALWQKRLTGARIWSPGPFEGPGILIVPIDERADIGFKLPDEGMNTSPRRFLMSSANQRWTSINGAINRPALAIGALLRSSERSSITWRTCVPDD